MSLQASLLVYDIPDALDYPNPSPILRKIGFRVNLSCWCVPDDRIPYNTIHDWTNQGISWRIVPFATEAAEGIVAMAREAIREEIRLAVEAAKATERKASAKPANEQGERYWVRVRAATCRARALLRDARAAARAFRLDEGNLAISSGLATIDALRVQAKQRAAQYAAMTAALSTVEGADSLHAAARADDLPHFAGADVLEEAGIDTSALRSAFAG